MKSTATPRNGASEPVAIREKRQRPAWLECARCGNPITVKARGRTPKWCSSSCRHRAWEQSRAAACGQAAVRIVERVVTLERTVKVPDKRLPRGREWADQLTSLTRQVQDGRLYDRDLRVVAEAAATLDQALQQRLARHDRPSRHY
jgi:ribosomal protein L34E